MYAFPFEGLYQDIAAFSGLTIKAVHPACTPFLNFSFTSGWVMAAIGGLKYNTGDTYVQPRLLEPEAMLPANERSSQYSKLGFEPVCN